MRVKVLDDYDDTTTVIAPSAVYYSPQECLMHIEAECGIFLVPNVEPSDYRYYSAQLFETGSLDLASRGLKGHWDEDED